MRNDAISFFSDKLMQAKTDFKLQLSLNLELFDQI